MRLISVVALLVLANPSWAAINPSLSASRTSGCVAPCAVFFDSSTTTWSDHSHFEAFLDLRYAWDFGDPTSGAWAISGKSKNQAYGPEAAHVYDSPGQYTVTMTVSDGTGAVANQQVMITVDDPNAVFAGANTICFSTSGNFSDCPAGAATQTTNSFATVMGYAAAGKRLLLRRGESWTSGDVSQLNNTGPGVIGAFAAGAKPRIVCTNGDAVIMAAATPNGTKDWRLVDLDFVGPSIDKSRVLQFRANTSQILVYRVDATNFGSVIQAHRDSLNFENSPAPHDQFFVVDSNFSHKIGLAMTSLIFVAAEHLAILGSNIEDGGESHNVRVQLSRPGVFEHNRVKEATGGGGVHLLKLHAPDFSADGCCNGYNEHVVVSDNVFIGFEAWNVNVAAQDEIHDQRLRSIIVERNYFTTMGPQSKVQYSLILSAPESVARNNIINQPNQWTFQTQGIGTMHTSGAEPLANVRIYNNTCYRGNGDLRCVDISDATVNAFVGNNLVYVPNAGSSTVAVKDSGSGTQLFNNLKVNTNPFVKSDPSAPDDFKLKANFAQAIDAGAYLPANAIDYWGDSRPVDGDGDGTAATDIGAQECRVDPPPAAPQLLD